MFELQRSGLMRLPADSERLRSIIDVTWIISENWLNYVSSPGPAGNHRRPCSTDTARSWRSYARYLCVDPHQITMQSYRTIKRLGATFLRPAAGELTASTARIDRGECR